MPRLEFTPPTFVHPQAGANQPRRDDASSSSTSHDAADGTQTPRPAMPNDSRRRIMFVADPVASANKDQADLQKWLAQKYAAVPGTPKLAAPLFTAADLPHVTGLAVAWAEKMEVLAKQVGRKLSDPERMLARWMGVADLGLVAVVDGPPPLHDVTLAQALEQAGITMKEVEGMTFGHGVFLNDPGALAHEMVHVAQYEAFGSIARFMACYVKQLNEYGYEDSGLEQAARRKVEQHHELDDHQ